MALNQVTYEAKSTRIPQILLAILLILAPQHADAGFFSIFTDLRASTDKGGLTADTFVNAQTIPLLKADISPDLEYGRGGGDVTIVAGAALVAESGPLGTINNIEDKPASQQISLYTVHENDTLSGIAKMFGVSVNTIMWANDMKSKTVKEGQVLVILPITGVLHTVKSGDTLQSIAKKYKADVNEIVQFNNIESVTKKLAIGEVLTVPDAEITSTPVTTAKKTTTATLRGAGGPAYGDYYTFPVDSGVVTQGLHGYNAVDIGAPAGTPIYAAAAGDVIISRSGGWNGGYGNYVVLSHPNGTQTLYGHMSKIIVAGGDRIYRGQVIGYVGSTGKSTGPHAHFEVRGAKNPFGK